MNVIESDAHLLKDIDTMQIMKVRHISHNRVNTVNEQVFEWPSPKTLVRIF